MNIQQALEIIKPAEHTMDALKSAYREAAKKYHPDVNPNGLEIMKLVNAAFDLLTEQFASWTLRGFEPEGPGIDERIQAIFEKIKHCSGIKAEVCGTWLWIQGDTRPYKDIFKSCGMKWSQNKTAWYWHPEGYRKRSRKSFGLDDIRSMFGSIDLESESMHAIA